MILLHTKCKAKCQTHCVTISELQEVLMGKRDAGHPFNISLVYIITRRDITRSNDSPSSCVPNVD